MKIRLLIVVLLTIGIIYFLTVVSGVPISYFIDIATILVVIGGSLILSAASYSPGEILRNFKISINDNGTLKELKTALCFFKTLRRFSYLMALIGFTTGFIAIIATLDDPNTKKLGLGFALAFLSIYTCIIYDTLIIATCQSRVNKQISLQE